MTEPALSLAFFDPAHQLHGTVRAGLAVLFADGKPSAVPEGIELGQEGDGYAAEMEGRLALTFSPLSGPLELGGGSARLCRVAGTADGADVDCLGTATETRDPPSWGELDAFRALSALFDAQHAVLAVALRPRGALGHGDERVTAWIVAAGEPLAVEDARISTVYDGEGRQRSAGLELWLPGEDFPRRVSGTAVAGTTLALEGLRVNAAVFDWRMEGRDGTGAYELTVRDEPAVA